MNQHHSISALKARLAMIAYLARCAGQVFIADSIGEVVEAMAKGDGR